MWHSSRKAFSIRFQTNLYRLLRWSKTLKKTRASLVKWGKNSTKSSKCTWSKSKTWWHLSSRWEKWTRNSRCTNICMNNKRQKLSPRRVTTQSMPTESISMRTLSARRVSSLAPISRSSSAARARPSWSDSRILCIQQVRWTPIWEVQAQLLPTTAHLK